MSRKTRKLIWSAPLLAVLAVAGALAMFAAQGTGNVFANPLPDAPMNLTVKAASGDAGRTTLVLSWDAAANASGYRIDKSKDRRVWETMVTKAAPHMDTTYMDDTLTADDLRWYRVLAVNSHGEGPISNIVSGTTSEKTNPGSVRNLQAAANGRKQIDLSWDAPADNGGEKIVGYQIQYHDGDKWAAIEAGAAADSVTTTTKTEYEDKFMLDPGQERLYRVRAVSGPVTLANASGADDSDDASKAWERIDGTTQMATDPGRVTGLTAVNTGTAGTEITLYWWAPEDNGGWDISHYIIQARPLNYTWKDVADADDLVIETLNGITANTGTLGDAADDDDPASTNITVAATQAVAQAVLTVNAVDHDREDGADDEQVEWDFRVYAITTDDGTDEEDTVDGREDDVLRRGPASQVIASATAGLREDTDTATAIPEHDPLQVPTVTATGGSLDIGPSGTGDDAPKKQEIVLGITADGDVPNQNTYRIDYREADSADWKELARDTTLTDFRGNRVYQDTDGLGFDERRYYRVFAVGTDWRRNVGPAVGANGWTAASGDPGKPTGVMASAPDLKTIMASWSAPKDNGGQPVTDYRYRYTLDDGDGVADPNDFADAATDRTDRPITSGNTGKADLMATIMVTDQDTTTQGDQFLAKERTYWLQVAAVNKNPLTDPATERPASGSEDWSVAAKFTTGKPTVPNMVEGLTSQNAVDTSGTVTGVLLLWNKPSSGAEATMYDVEMKDDEGEWVTPTSDATDITGRTSYTDPDEPEMDEMRTYRVRGENASGEGEWTMVTFPRDPDTHTHVAAMGTIPAQEVTVGMETTVDATMYFSDNTDAMYAAESDMEQYATVDADASSGMVTITGVAEGTATITITATSGAVKATQTFKVTVKPAALGKPMNVMAEIMIDDTSAAGSVTNVKVTWEDGANADVHHVFLIDINNFPRAISARVAGAPSAMTHTFSNVASGVYVVAVQSTLGEDYDYDLYRQENGRVQPLVIQ